MRTIFEDSVLFALDAFVPYMSVALGISYEQIVKGHSNLGQSGEIK